MQNPMAPQVHFDDYQTQVAWVNEHDWQFGRPTKRYPVRQAIAKALISLANVLSPAATPETQKAS